MATMADTFRDTESGIRVFTNGTARELLAATLNNRLTSEPSAEARREAEEDAASEEVRTDARWERGRAFADLAVEAGVEFAAASERQARDLKPERFAAWLAEAEEGLARAFLDLTAKFREVVDEIEVGYSRSTSPPLALTTPGAIELSIRMDLLDGATPGEARELVLDAQKRGDRGFLYASGVLLRSWAEYKNSWQAADARSVASELLDVIDASTWTPGAARADAAKDFATRMRLAWAYLMRTLVGEKRLDPLHRQAGALSPIYEPEPE